MTTTPPDDPDALVTIDLSGGDETPVQTVGRVIAGTFLLIVGGAAALAFLAAYLLGWLVPAIADWVELLGDGLLYAAIVAFVIAVVGFELVRRGKKARKQEAAQAADIMGKLQAVGAMDGTATPEQIEAALEQPTGDLKPQGPTETRL